MKCPTKKLSAYLDGELTGETRRAVDLHLSRCEGCKKRLDRIKLSWDLLDTLGEARDNPFLYTRVRSALMTGKKQPRWRERVLLPVTALIALALGLFLGSLLTRHSAPVSTLAENDPYTRELETAAGSMLGDLYMELASQQLISNGNGK